jgi:asparagine synthase (glutamine-hydrolysing)
MGFGVPLDRWFRDELKGMAFDLLLSRRVRDRGLLQEDAVRRLLVEHASGTYARHYQIWNLVMLESWFRMFVDQRPTEPPLAAGASTAPAA